MHESRAATAPLLQLVGVSVAFPRGDREVLAVDDVSLDIDSGECVGLVGESGSGKTMTALAAMRLVPRPGRISAGQVLWRGRNVLEMPTEEVRQMRGAGAAMVSQNPMTALNPVLSVGFQVGEAMEVHGKYTASVMHARVPALMTQVGIPAAVSRQHDYPHQFSGGMRQRICIAMALSNEPGLIIADEPTTALDVTIRAQILAELRRLREETGSALLVITHDIDVVRAICDRVIVMYAGQIVEVGPANEILSQPEHPYTWSLLRSAPRLALKRMVRLPSIQGAPPDPTQLPSGCRFHPRCPFAVSLCSDEMPQLKPLEGDRSARCVVLMRNTGLAADGDPHADQEEGGAQSVGYVGPPRPALVQLTRVTKEFRLGGGIAAPVRLAAVVDVSLDIATGETLGLVGESGSGKSTLGRLALGLERPTRGEVRMGGEDLAKVGRRRLRAIQRRAQVIFQDPYSALDPRMTVGTSIAEPLRARGITGRRQRHALVAEAMLSCGLRPKDASRFPHEFSGGQLQRVCIARALIGGPALVVADEPVASLDVSIQAQIINLLRDLQKAGTLTYLFISHDLAVIRHVADRVAVMYLGKIVELGSNEQVYSGPLHPYTLLLLAAGAPRAATLEMARVAGEIPSPVRPPSGCRFHTRCPRAQFPICSDSEPEWKEYARGHWAACHFAGTEAATRGSAWGEGSVPTGPPVSTDRRSPRTNGLEVTLCKA